MNQSTSTNEQITPEQAFEILWNGHAVRITGGFFENHVVFLTDTMDIDVLETQSKQQSEKDVDEYLSRYEIRR